MTFCQINFKWHCNRKVPKTNHSTFPELTNCYITLNNQPKDVSLSDLFCTFVSRLNFISKTTEQVVQDNFKKSIFTTTMLKIKNSIQHRLPVWQQMLARTEGVSIEEMAEACAAFISKSEDPNGILRRDLTTIRSLLNDVEGAELVERKQGRCKRFWLQGDADLLRLRQERFYGSENVTLTSMLTQMEGMLPEGVLQEATASIRKLEREQTEAHARPIVAYESNVGLHRDTEHFYPIYKAIQGRQALHVVRHPQYNSGIQEELILYPEFLRQYNTLWHVFGVATTMSGEMLTVPSERIPLHLISSVTPLPAKQYPFIPSGIEDYIEDYFSEIIGVDNVASVPVSDIHFAVKKTSVNRLMDNPLHESMTHLRGEISPIPGYHLFRMQVKFNMELMRKILQMGSEIIILSPEKLRRKVLKELQKSIKLYVGTSEKTTM